MIIAPGTYELGNTLSDIRYTMRPKPEKSSLVLSSVNVPGPGRYESLPAINEKGRYPISKFHNSCATLFNPKSSKRFTDDYGIKLVNSSHKSTRTWIVWIR